MAQAFRAGSLAASQVFQPTSLVLAEGTGWADQDIVLALAFCVGSGTTLGRPTGWTNIFAGTQGNIKWDLAWKLRTSSAFSTAERTWTSGSASNRDIEVQALAFTGVHPTSPIASAGTAGGSGLASGHNPDPPNNTDVGTNSLVVCGGGNENGGSTAVVNWVAPTNYTIQSAPDSAIALPYICLAVRTLDALISGAENPAAFAGSTGGSLDYWDGFTIGLAPATGGTTLTPAQGAVSLAGLAASLGFAINMPDEP